MGKTDGAPGGYGCVDLNWYLFHIWCRACGTLRRPSSGSAAEYPGADWRGESTRLFHYSVGGALPASGINADAASIDRCVRRYGRF